MRDRSAPALVSILARTSGRAALMRGGPLYLGILVLGVVIFGGNDAPARELTNVARHQPAFRCLLLTLWLILAAPVARTLLASPASRFVRVFPVSWTSAAACLVLGLVAATGVPALRLAEGRLAAEGS